jgi:hypothetical protein
MTSGQRLESLLSVKKVRFAPRSGLIKEDQVVEVSFSDKLWRRASIFLVPVGIVAVGVTSELVSRNSTVGDPDRWPTM